MLRLTHGSIPIVILTAAQLAGAQLTGTQESRMFSVGDQHVLLEVYTRAGERMINLPGVVLLAEDWTWDGMTGVLSLRLSDGALIRAVEGEDYARVGDTIIRVDPGIQYTDGTLWIPVSLLEAAGVVEREAGTEVPGPTATEPPLPGRLEADPTSTPSPSVTATPAFGTPAPGGPTISVADLQVLGVLIDPSLPPSISPQTTDAYEQRVEETILDICLRLQSLLVEDYGAEAWLSLDESTLLEEDRWPSPAERVSTANRLNADVLLSIRGGRSFGSGASPWTVAFHSPWLGRAEPQRTQGPIWWRERGIALRPWDYIDSEQINLGKEIAEHLHHDLSRRFESGPGARAFPGPLAQGTGGPRPACLALARGSEASVVVVALGNASDDTTLRLYLREDWRQHVARILAYSLANWQNRRLGRGEIPFKED